MKDNKKIEVDKVDKTPIYFEPASEKFFVGESEYRSLYEAKQAIARDKETAFEGDFFINESWDGIVEFKAKRKIYDQYERVYKISGDKQKTAGNSRVEVEEKDLFPRSEENIALKEKADKMGRDGWAMINASKRLGSQLKKY